MAEVRDNPAEHRFEIWVDEGLAGFSDYHDRGLVRSFVHTEVEPAFEGQGLASQLIAAAIEEAKETGRSVLPFCPFVRSWIERHPDFVELVPVEHRARFDLEGSPA